MFASMVVDEIFLLASDMAKIDWDGSGAAMSAMERIASRRAIGPDVEIRARSARHIAMNWAATTVLTPFCRGFARGRHRIERQNRALAGRLDPQGDRGRVNVRRHFPGRNQRHRCDTVLAVTGARRPSNHAAELLVNRAGTELQSPLATPVAPFAHSQRKDVASEFRCVIGLGGTESRPRASAQRARGLRSRAGHGPLGYSEFHVDFCRRSIARARGRRSVQRWRTCVATYLEKLAENALVYPDPLVRVENYPADS